MTPTPPTMTAREVTAKLIPHTTSVHNVALIEQYAAEREAAAYERAAQACLDNYSDPAYHAFYRQAAGACAHLIRSLKGGVG